VTLVGTIAMCLHHAQPAAHDGGLHPLRESILYRPGHPYAPWHWYAPYPGYWYSPCYPLATCNPWLEYRLLERRLQRADELRRGPPASPPALALPYGPPGPESELRPEYRDSGKVRPEYEGSGQFRRGLLEERERRSPGGN
jgi:hypothetical protein